jgi:uncharacterized protein
MGLFSGIFSKTIGPNILQKRGDVYYEPNQSKPFSGKVTDQYINGQNKYEEIYEGGKQNGEWTWWDENGQIKHEEIYFMGEKTKEINYKNGLKHGLTIRYNLNDIVEEEHYKNGNLHGLSVCWMHGKRRGYKWSENNYKDGQRHGLSISWRYSDPYTGIKASEALYENGDLDGQYTEYHENGQKKRENSYRNGKPHGRYTEWDENGELIYTLNYENGNEV